MCCSADFGESTGIGAFSAATVWSGGRIPLATPLAIVSAVIKPIRLAFLDDRRVGRRVHRRFRPAQRLQGNFLSHFVFVLAQLLHAMGVLPADLGIMPLAAGMIS